MQGEQIAGIPMRAVRLEEVRMQARVKGDLLGTHVNMTHVFSVTVCV